MIKIRNVQPKAVKQGEKLPGTRGNSFDRVLHFEDPIQKVPLIALGGVFALISFIVSGLDVQHAALLFLFFIIDYGLLLGLPYFKISYGPVKPVWIILALLRSLFWLLPQPVNFWLEVAGILLILYGFYLEPQALKSSQITLSSAKIPAGAKLKILHLGDLHIERLTRREEKILTLIEKEQPDLILFSGDFLNLSYLHDEKAQADLKSFLNSLHAPLGVYGVTGSPAVDLTELFPGLVQNTPLTLINNQELEIDSGSIKIVLTGLPCSHNPDRDYTQLQSFHTQSNLFSILLYHSPDIAPLVCNAGFDLQLSGHVHGGQIRLLGFGALYTASLYGKLFEGGLYQLKQMTLFVTRGIGLEGAAAPRVRVLCPPEITFFTLQR